MDNFVYYGYVLAFSHTWLILAPCINIDKPGKDKKK